MVTISSVEFQRKFGRYRDAAQREPVVITNHGRENLVLLSVDEYRRLKRRDRQALRVEDLTQADLEALASAEPPTQAEAFNDEFEG